MEGVIGIPHLKKGVPYMVPFQGVNSPVCWLGFLSLAPRLEGAGTPRDSWSSGSPQSEGCYNSEMMNGSFKHPTQSWAKSLLVSTIFGILYPQGFGEMSPEFLANIIFQMGAENRQLVPFIPHL